MSRYIDLEELEKRINENIKPETLEEKALIEWCKDEYIRQGYAMPTADVVEIVMDILDEAYEILKELKDEYRRNEEIREACAVRCAMIKLAELKDKYTEDNASEG